MRPDTKFSGDDLRRSDPKFQQPRFAQYLSAVQRLDLLIQRYGRRVIHLAVRWVIDQGITIALWGARNARQLQPAADVMGWSLERSAKAEIQRILDQFITHPIGPEFMAPPTRK
jgi:aryl-alcohol dehydrogenase-like predicted oxidoreductase